MKYKKEVTVHRFRVYRSGLSFFVDPARRQAHTFLASRLEAVLAPQVRVHESTTILCTAPDGLNFPAGSGERQKHVSALHAELASGCKAPGLYGKN